MTSIGLISDTHGTLDEAILKFLQVTDQVWHAGDIGNLETADKLAAMKPLRAVYGNIDGHELRRVYPETLRFKVEEVEVWMTHIGGYPGHYEKGLRKMLEQPAPAILVCGHSHILRVMNDKRYKLLFINPGAAGRSGFHLVQTAVRFSISGTRIHDLEVFEKPRK
jgi:uncharacterized protein